MLFKVFIESQFNYCPLFWMLHSRTMNNEISLLHERSLRIVYSDQSSVFEELLERDGTFSIHLRNIQSLAINILQICKLSEKCIWALQLQSKNSKIRYRNNLVSSSKNMVYSTSDHKRKHFHILLQNENKEMETRLPMQALQEIFATCWFCIYFLS